MGTAGDIAIARAERHLGETNNTERFAYGKDTPWCAAFATEAARLKYGKYCPSVERWAKENNLYISKEEALQGKTVPKGSVVLFYTDKSGTEPHHAGLLRKDLRVNARNPNDTVVPTIEGNATQDYIVVNKTRTMPEIRGFIDTNAYHEHARRVAMQKQQALVAHNFQGILRGNAQATKPNSDRVHLASSVNSSKTSVNRSSRINLADQPLFSCDG